jgi:PAS domain S-box-containing protein
MDLDLRTLIVAVAIIDILQAIVVYFQYRLNRSFRGIGWWLLGSVTVAMGFFSILLREIAPIAQVSIVLSNTLFILGIIFFYVGIKRFFDEKEDRRIIISSFAIYVIIILYFTYGNDDIEARTVIQGVAISIISLLTAHGLLTNKPRTTAGSISFLAAVFLAQACFFGFRTLYVLAFPINSVFTPTLDQTLLFLFVLIEGFLYTFGFIFMVNQRLTAELRESKEHFELIFNTGPDAMFITSLLDGKVINVNEGFTKVTGYTRDETIGGTSLALWKNPEDRQKVVKDIREKGTCENFEAEFLRKDGSQLTGVMSAKSLSIHGDPFIISVTRDITERKRAEERLRETMEYLQSLLDYANAPIVVWRPDFAITIFNRAFERLTGMGSDQVVGKPLEQLFPEDTRLDTMAFIRQTSFGEHWENVEIPIRGKDGSVRVVLWNSANLTSPVGQAIATIAHGQDITERKLAENALQEVNKKLNLLSSITRHDIKNQLMVLEANLALLKMNQMDLASNNHLLQTEAAAERISAMIRFTREYEDIGVHSPIWQDIRSLVETGIKSISLGRIESIDDVPSGLEVFADPLIVKVFQNLVDNAMRHGGRIKTIHFFVEEAGGAQAIICEDDGDGISGEIKKKLFTRGSGKDHGLGLFLSREILSITGITIEEKGEPGRGARFVMTVPRSGFRARERIGTRDGPVGTIPGGRP